MFLRSRGDSFKRPFAAPCTHSLQRVAATSELSFKKKVDMMASLVRQRLRSTRFNVGDDPPVEVLDELVKILFQAEGLHSRIMHSSWVLARLESYVGLN